MMITPIMRSSTLHVTFNWIKTLISNDCSVCALFMDPITMECKQVRIRYEGMRQGSRYRDPLASKPPDRSALCFFSSNFTLLCGVLVSADPAASGAPLIEVLLAYLLWDYYDFDEILLEWTERLFVMTFTVPRWYLVTQEISAFKIHTYLPT